MPATNYNFSPSPTTGKGAYGKVPGTVGLPPNIYEGVTSVYSGLPALTGGAGDIIKRQMAGELSPETINRIQDEAAAFGVASGMPSSQFSGYRGLRNLGLSVEGRQQQGLDNYSKFLSSLGQTVTDPNLAASIGSSNAALNAAPDPEAAFKAQLAAYLKAMQQAAAAGRNPGGGMQGMGFVPNQPSGELGFGAGGPGMLVGNSMATGFEMPTDNPLAASNWNAWNASMPWSNPTNFLSEDDIWNSMGANNPFTEGISDPYADLETGYNG